MHSNKLLTIIFSSVVVFLLPIAVYNCGDFFDVNPTAGIQTGKQIASINEPLDKRIFKLKQAGYDPGDIKSLLGDEYIQLENELSVNDITENPLVNSSKTSSNLPSIGQESVGLAKCAAWPYTKQNSSTYSPQIVSVVGQYLASGQTIDAYTITSQQSSADPFMVIFADLDGSGMQTFTVYGHNDDNGGYQGGKSTDSRVTFTSSADRTYYIMTFSYSTYGQGTTELIVKVNGNTARDQDISVVGHAIHSWGTGSDAQFAITTDPSTVSGSEDPMLTAINFNGSVGYSNDDFGYYWTYCYPNCGNSSPVGYTSSFPDYTAPRYCPEDGNNLASSIQSEMLFYCSGTQATLSVPNGYQQGVVLLHGYTQGGSVDYYQYGNTQ